LGEIAGQQKVQAPVSEGRRYYTHLDRRYHIHDPLLLDGSNVVDAGRRDIPLADPLDSIEIPLAKLSRGTGDSPVSPLL
jgi:hypothetical protein